MSTISQSAALRLKMEITCAPLSEAFGELWARPDLDRLFPEFLIHLHFIMRSSVPLMEHALIRARELSTGTRPDEVAAPLVAYLEGHIEEEKDHDLWTLEDLEAIGYRREAVLARLPSPAIAAMAGAQYYWIHHHHPLTLLGYIAILEWAPPSAAHIARLKERTGLPEAAFRTYAMHGELDPGHGDELGALIDALPLDREQAGWIGISAMHTADRFAEALRQMMS